MYIEDGINIVLAPFIDTTSDSFTSILCKYFQSLPFYLTFFMYFKSAIFFYLLLIPKIFFVVGVGAC